jgi:hypothetical protein
VEVLRIEMSQVVATRVSRMMVEDLKVDMGIQSISNMEPKVTEIDTVQMIKKILIIEESLTIGQKLLK